MAIIIIYHITRWFKIIEYNDKCAISIKNLVENICLTRYTWPTEITYDQGLEFIGREFINSLLEREYIILANPTTSVNPTSNATLEWIHSVIVNHVRTNNIQGTHIYDGDP